MSYGQTAVLSNFDSRLPILLKSLEMQGLFDVVKTSHAIGVEKPAAAAFDATRTAFTPHIPPRRCIHVGDNVKTDVAGALAAGWHCIAVGASEDDVAAILQSEDQYDRVVCIPNLSQLSSAALAIMAMNPS